MTPEQQANRAPWSPFKGPTTPQIPCLLPHQPQISGYDQSAHGLQWPIQYGYLSIPGISTLKHPNLGSCPHTISIFFLTWLQGNHRRPKGLPPLRPLRLRLLCWSLLQTLADPLAQSCFPSLCTTPCRVHPSYGFKDH